MRLDCDRYRVNYTKVKELTKGKSIEDIYKFISMLSLSTGVPIIIVCCYIGELYGFTKPLTKTIKRLKMFYKIEDIINIRETIKNE